MKPLAALLLLLVTSASVLAQPAAPITLIDDRITVTGDRYSVDFRAADGSIARIVDRTIGAAISTGSASLWTATFDDDARLTASEDAFSYTIDAGERLTLRYTGLINATVTLSVLSENALSMKIELSNQSGQVIRLVSFPGDLALPAREIRDALLPLMPGALLNADFFASAATFVDQYPGVMFADYAALRSSAGKLALYTQAGAVVQPVYLGFAPEGGTTLLRHNFKTWIADGASWTSPVVIVRVGEDYPATIAAYRAENGIDQYPSLAEKLGEAAPTYFAAPMIKLDLAALGQPFADLKQSVIDRLNFPGIVHFVAFQNGGHDNNYPDFIPPAPRWGSTEDFANLVAAVHRQGGLAVPYTNFSWWDNNGPAITTLPDGLTLADVIVSDAHGLPAFESYGSRSGFVVDPNNAFFRQKVAEQHDLLLDSVGMDGIFEDQWGARSAPYDFNPAAEDPDTAYFAGVLAHFRDQAASNLLVEQGVDALARAATAFMGTNYLWDLLGYRTTAAYTSYYPLAGMLLRDKVLLYQHNLAAQTWTNGKDMLRWNLAQGYSLSNSVFDERIPGLNVDNPWLNLVGVFQKYALAHYADERITRYDDLGGGVTRTEFETYSVSANWHDEQAYTLDDMTLPPGGVVTRANDGAVVAGVFTRYGGHDLSAGEHYLVGTRAEDEIRIFQPVGAETTLHIRIPWTSVTVAAYRYDGTQIASVEATLAGDEVLFAYRGVVNGEAVGYYRIRPT